MRVRQEGASIKTCFQVRVKEDKIYCCYRKMEIKVVEGKDVCGVKHYTHSSGVLAT